LGQEVTEILTGEVVSGFGWHKKNMGPWSALPFRAYPGTLNLKVGQEAVEGFMREKSEWFEHKNCWYFYRTGTLNGTPVAVTDSGTSFGQVEVFAAVRLRSLPLVDGDTVTILLNGDVE